MKSLYLVLLIIALIPFTTFAQTGQTASEILDQAGVQGGLIVHLGCGDGKLTAALAANERYLVHGLDANAGNVAAARQTIQSLGQYGRVSVEQWTGDRLPYADNLVNLLVISDAKVKVADEEIQRVLAPHGVALRLNPQSTIQNSPSPGPKKSTSGPMPCTTPATTPFRRIRSSGRRSTCNGLPSPGILGTMRPRPA